MGFVIVVWVLDFTAIAACSQRKAHALPVHLPNALRFPKSIPWVVAAGSVPDPQEDSRFDKAGHAGHHCQGASDRRFPNSSSLLSPCWSPRQALEAHRAPRPAAESQPRSPPTQRLRHLLLKRQPMLLGARHVLRKGHFHYYPPAHYFFIQIHAY